MKKLAVIVVGKHYAGKTKTLKYAKPILGISKYKHVFTLGKCRGYLKTQTLQEPDPPVDIESLDNYQRYDVFILPSRPKGEGSPTLQEIKKKLRELGFKISEVNIEKRERESYYKNKAKEIVNIVKKHCKK